MGFDTAEIGDPMNPMKNKIYSGGGPMNAANASLCCGHLHQADAGGVCADCPDKANEEGKMEQLAHWKGQEGDSYIERNTEAVLLSAYTHMWSRIMSSTHEIKSVLEVGANIGVNLQAIQHIMPFVTRSAIEPNTQARTKLLQHGIGVYPYVAEEPWDNMGMFDLVFTRGVLIHVNPKSLPLVYENMYNHSSRYIVMAEYFAPKREMIPYHGQNDLLWRADYAGEIMDMYDNLKLVDYFFVYKRDLIAPQDNVTVFIMEKT